MNFQEAKTSLIRFMTMTEEQIKDLFMTFPDARRMGINGDKDFESIFVPGTRDDKALLVAHIDTVWNDSPNIKIGESGGILYSLCRDRTFSKVSKHPKQVGLGIGADDRAGIAILFALKDLGHSLLLTGCEEHGAVGSSLLMRYKSNIETISNHQFAVQFDRHGFNDAVFYNVGSKEFYKYVTKETGFYKVEGSFTDICILCRDIQGVNLSVGYLREHTVYENIDINAWMRTLSTAEKWLSKPNLPAFHFE